MTEDYDMGVRVVIQAAADTSLRRLVGMCEDVIGQELGSTDIDWSFAAVGPAEPSTPADAVGIDRRSAGPSEHLQLRLVPA